MIQLKDEAESVIGNNIDSATKLIRTHSYNAAPEETEHGIRIHFAHRTDEVAYYYGYGPEAAEKRNHDMYKILTSGGLR